MCPTLLMTYTGVSMMQYGNSSGFFSQFLIWKIVYKKFIVNRVSIFQREIFASYVELEINFLIQVDKIILSCHLNGLKLN